MIDITAIAEALVGLAVAVISTAVTVFVRKYLSNKQRQELLALIKLAVEAAEQIYAGTGRGAEKKAFVLDWLEKRGVTVDMEELDAMIEAAVYQLGEALHGD